MRRLKQLDGLRALAFLAVFLYAAFGLPLLWTGVDLFFVLSGFLITTILRQQREVPGAWKSFYLRRVFRILPPYIAFMGISWVVVRYDWTKLWYWYVFLGANIREAFGGSGTRVLAPLWSLAVEEQFYLAWPFLVFKCSRQALIRILAALIVSAAIFRGAFTPIFANYSPIYHLTPFRMDLLASGSLIAILREQRAESKTWRIRSIACLGTGLVLFSLFSIGSTFRAGANSMLFNIFGYSLICVIYSGLVAYLAEVPEDSMVSRALAFGPLRSLGVISYTCYLFHQLVLVVLHGDRGFGSLLALCLVVALGAFSWFVYERRLIELGRALAGAPAPAPTRVPVHISSP